MESMVDGYISGVPGRVQTLDDLDVPQQGTNNAKMGLTPGNKTINCKWLSFSSLHR